MKRKILVLLCVLALLVSVAAVYAAADTEYTQLPQSVSSMEILAGETQYIDLNGKNIESVTVNAGAILYVKDSKTDDYTVEDDDYGRIISVSGEGKVVAADGYAKITEADGVSFHAVDLELKTLTLRPEDAGMYYKSAFKGDEVVARNVQTYGVALSTKAEPTEDNLKTDCKYSYFTGFTAGADGNDNAATSTVLKNIMKPENGYMANKSNAATAVYGRAYILTEDGYTFGTCAAYSLQDALELYNTQLETAAATEVPEEILTLYNGFTSVMSKWNISYITDCIAAAEQAQEDAVLKILGIGNSFTIDCMKPLYDIYKAHNPGKKVKLGILYYSGCTLAQHVDFLSAERAVYDYYEMSDEIFEETGGKWKITNGVTMRYGIEEDQWDIVTMQQGVKVAAQPETYNDDIGTIRAYVQVLLGRKPVFAWNMTWALPEDPNGDEGLLKDSGTSSYYSDFINRFVSNANMYSLISQSVQDKIINGEYEWDYMMPAGTAVQNAKTNYGLEYVDLYDDYCHLRYLGAIIAAYSWYCEFEGVTELDEVKVKTLTSPMIRNTIKQADGTYKAANVDVTFTETQLAIILESVNDAIANNYAVTDRTTES